MLSVNKRIGDYCINLYDDEEVKEKLNMPIEQVDEMLYTYEQILASKNKEYENTLKNGGRLDFIAVEWFNNKEFNDVLEEYLKKKGTSLERAVRDIVPASDIISGKPGFLMEHGINYDWASADLLGGEADGKRREEFNNYLSDYIEKDPETTFKRLDSEIIQRWSENESIDVYEIETGEICFDCCYDTKYYSSWEDVFNYEIKDKLIDEIKDNDNIDELLTKEEINFLIKHNIYSKKELSNLKQENFDLPKHNNIKSNIGACDNGRVKPLKKKI